MSGCHRNYLLAFLVITSLVVTLADDEEAAEDTAGHGLGSQYDWVKLEDAFSTSKELKKPVLIVIHKSWCGACRSLKPKIAKSESILKLSKYFVMVNIFDDEEPKDELYRPGGATYVPRILFFNDLGEPLTDIINEGGNSEYPYYYYNDEGITASMKSCLTKLNIEYEEEAGENNHTEL